MVTIMVNNGYELMLLLKDIEGKFAPIKLISDFIGSLMRAVFAMLAGKVLIALSSVSPPEYCLLSSLVFLGGWVLKATAYVIFIGLVVFLFEASRQVFEKLRVNIVISIIACLAIAMTFLGAGAGVIVIFSQDQSIARDLLDFYEKKADATPES